MTFLKIGAPQQPGRCVELVRRLTSVGRAAGNTVSIDHPSVPEFALHLEQLADGITLSVQKKGTVLLNGRKCAEARLSVGDRLQIGEVSVEIAAEAAEPDASLKEPTLHAAASSPPHLDDLQALNTLIRFSEALLGDYRVEALLDLMMDQVIALTRADRGFLILIEEGVPQVRVARNLRRENIEGAGALLSDSIIAEAIRTRRPMLVRDALSDPHFSQSESVVNLRLLSVLCAPLVEKGEVFGLIYVGSDRADNGFDERVLALIQIWAAQGSLILRNALLLDELKLDNAALRGALERQRFGTIIGACDGMREVYRKIAKVATSDVSVLVTGETGTGKELIARELHERSARAKGPFVTLNCGAIPENLLESELFGHLRGAFTGAVATRKGKFQAAHGGTLFLDEIGEMPMALQVKILRALQDRQITKVGDSRAEDVDIRIVAATNRVLEEEIAQGRFREDLFYRLNVVSLHLPPLRERGGDILVLARYFLGRSVRELGSKVKGFAPSALSALMLHRWSGNVRELENRVKKAVILAERALITDLDLELDVGREAPVVPLAQAKEAFARRYINEVLERNGGNRAQTARDLDVDPRTIFRHLEQERGGEPASA